MPLARRILLALFTLLPLVTLVHKNEVHRWDVNRSLMNAPDEFSYMLTADALLHGPHISTQTTLGIDTFYPPGYSLLLAAWALVFGLTPFAAHVLNTLLVCAASVVVYFFGARLLALLQAGEHRRFHWSAESCRWIALLIAGIFAANWHVLEGALFVLSEPAFTLATLAWLALALKWPDWHLSPRKTLAVAALAVAAWSIRGAGIVCIAVTFLYPCMSLLKSKIENRKSKITSIVLILVLAVAYQVTIAIASPNKSLTGADSAAHGYPRQLLDGLTIGGKLHPANPQDWPALAQHVGAMAMAHLDDYAAAFMPPFREPPDWGWRYNLSKLLGGLGLLGFLHRLTRRTGEWANGRDGKSAGLLPVADSPIRPLADSPPPRVPPALRLLDLYILSYFALYLIWPFAMPRFWTPILPVMLVYLVDGIRGFWGPRVRLTEVRAAALLLSLLLILSLQELSLQLGFYQRRLNLVSDALADSAATVMRVSPDPHNTVIAVAGSTEHFVFAWYLPSARAPATRTMPLSPKPPEHVEALLLRCIAELREHPEKRLFVIKYFTDVNYADVFANLRKEAPEVMGTVNIRRLYQNENITTVWELRPKKQP